MKRNNINLWSDKIAYILEQLATLPGLLSIILMAVVILFEVFYRYVLFNPLSWSDEFAVYCNIWMGFLGIGVAIKHDEHPALNFVLERLPPHVSKVLKILGMVLTSIFFLCITIWGFEYAIISGKYRMSWALGISMVLPMISVPIGSLFAFLQLILRLIRIIIYNNQTE